MSLAVRKSFLRQNVIYRFQSKSSVFVDVNISAENHNFNIPLILNEYNIMITMKKIKFMQEFTFAINVECLHGSLQAKLLSTTAHVQNMQKHVFVAYKGF